MCQNAYRKIRDIKNDKRLKKIITYWPVGHLHDILTIHPLKKHPSKPELCYWMWRKWKWKSLSRVWLFVDPMDYAVHGILQARILAWVAYPFFSRSSWPRNLTRVSCIANWAIKEAIREFYFLYVFRLTQYMKRKKKKLLS